MKSLIETSLGVGRISGWRQQNDDSIYFEKRESSVRSVASGSSTKDRRSADVLADSTAIISSHRLSTAFQAIPLHQSCHVGSFVHGKH
jgi:hypothetical protein